MTSPPARPHQQGLTDSADVVVVVGALRLAVLMAVVAAADVVVVVVVVVAAVTVAATEFIIFVERQYLFKVYLVINNTIRCETLRSQLQCIRSYIFFFVHFV